VKVSVAMATYNGENFIKEQLESLLNQKRQADEVIICDDGSTDSTIEIVDEFIKNNNLSDKWELIENEYNKGYTRNFLDCASETTGDIIFFCDQDDIWDNEKISKMEIEFESNSNIKALSCSTKIIDQNGNKTNYLMNFFNELRIKNKQLEKISFEKQVRNNLSAGLTLALKRDKFDFIKPIILKHNLSFDLPIGLLTSITGEYFILGEKLVFRRVHNKNISNPSYTLKSRIGNIKKHIKGRKIRIKLLKVCKIEMKDHLTKKQLKNIDKTIYKLKKSIKDIKNRNLFSAFMDLFAFNPMLNKTISIINILCILFGDYKNVDISDF
jgi:glycosyltransferase involved in cell wall biosynthesis